MGRRFEIDLEIVDGMFMSRCKYCSKRIVWMTMEGKRVALNEDTGEAHICKKFLRVKKNPSPSSDGARNMKTEKMRKKARLKTQCVKLVTGGIKNIIYCNFIYIYKTHQFDTMTSKES